MIGKKQKVMMITTLERLPNPNHSKIKMSGANATFGMLWKATMKGDTTPSRKGMLARMPASTPASSVAKAKPMAIDAAVDATWWT